MENENGSLREKAETLQIQLTSVDRKYVKEIKSHQETIEKLEEDLNETTMKHTQISAKAQQQNEIINELQEQILAMANAEDLDSQLAQSRSRVADMEVRGLS